MNNVASLWKLIEKGRNGENIGTSTGLPKLDKIIGGIQQSRYYLLSAASSGGKTAMVLYIMYQMLRNMTPDKPVYFCYFSLEIGSEVLLAKLMGLYCAEEFGVYMTINEIMSYESTISLEKFEYLRKAKEWLDTIEPHIKIIDSTLTAKSLYRQFSSFAEEHGDFETIEDRTIYIPNNPKQLLIGIIDHLSLITASEGRKLKEEMDLASSFMVTLKRKLRSSWFVLMQQNRDSSSMDRRKEGLSEPNLNDVRDSSSPVNDSDVTLQLFYPFREKLNSYRGYPIIGDKAFKSGFRSCIVNKNRYGIANQVIGMAFYGSVGYFKELPKAESISDPSIYFKEEDNIPCKKITLEVKDEFEHKESDSKGLTFEF